MEYLYLYLTKFQSTCTLLKYFQMYLAPCLAYSNDEDKDKVLDCRKLMEATEEISSYA